MGYLAACTTLPGLTARAHLWIQAIAVKQVPEWRQHSCVLLRPHGSLQELDVLHDTKKR